MKQIPALLAAFAVLCLLPATAVAHGGQYRGPTVTAGRGTTPGNPGIPGPTTPGRGMPGPITPSGKSTPDVTRWQVWWELNKDPYLRAPKLALAPKSPEAARKIITDQQKLDVILPALKKTLAETTNQHVTSACMIALAKIGLDHPKFKILDLFRKRLRRGNQEIREVAALALGIAKKVEAIDDLAALLEDTAKGRKLMGRESVDERTRTFAAYGLGLIARGTDDVKVKFEIYECLKRVLTDREEKSRDVLIAVLNGFRLLDPQPSKGSTQRRLLWAALETLETYQARRMGKSRQAIQAHVPTAVARMLGRSTTADHERVKKLYSDIFRSRRKRHHTLYQSTSIAMGRLLVAEEEHKSDGTHLLHLRRHLDKTKDQLTYNFGLIAIGQIGGEKNLARLLKVFKTGKRARKAWAALALGLMAFHAKEPQPDPQTQTPPKRLGDEIGGVLHKVLLRSNDRDLRAAIGLGLGLCRYTKAAPAMRKLLKKYSKSAELAGYLSMGLALMDDKASGKQIHELMAKSSRRPLLMTQAAMALARLRHPGASATLRRILRESGPMRTLTLASTSSAMGFLANPANVDPLVRILGDSSNNKLVRAFAAVALGSMAENDPLTWSSWIAMNMNYSATVETLSNGSSGILDIL